MATPRILRMSTLFLRTLRDDPADAEVPSHRLLARGGYIRRAAPGGFTSIDPVYEYVHTAIAGGDAQFKGNSVVGGHVYRGKARPAERGRLSRTERAA